MFNDLKPYPDYDLCYGSTLGKIPTHWNSAKLKRLVTVMGGATPAKERREFWDEGSIPWVSPKDMKTEIVGDSIDHITEAALAESSVRLVPAGAVLMVVRGMILAKRVPIALTSAPVALNQDMKALIPSELVLDGVFLAQTLRGPSLGLHDLVTEAGHGTKKLDSEAWEQLVVPVPPLVDQRAIAAYLAHAHQRINKVIKTKRRLISLWEEEKDAIVVASVSGGLRSDEYLTASIRGWRGYCPSGWEVVALRHRYVQELGKMLLTSRFTGEHAVPYLRNVDVRWGSVRADDLPLMDIAEDEYDRYTVRSGDVLVCEGGAGVGRAAVWEGEGTVGFQKALHRLRPINSDCDDPRFLVYVFRACWSARVFTYNSVSTIPHLTGEQLRALRLPWPSGAEQRAIVKQISAESALIESKISGAHREIDLLEEFKARLTADVVTGQVDVRAIAATLPPIDPAEAFDGGSLGVEDEVDVEESEVEVSEEPEVA